MVSPSSCAAAAAAAANSVDWQRMQHMCSAFSKTQLQQWFGSMYLLQAQHTPAMLWCLMSSALSSCLHHTTTPTHARAAGAFLHKNDTHSTQHALMHTPASSTCRAPWPASL
jgi:hypothetical protein